MQLQFEVRLVDRQLMDYLPEVMKSFEEIKQIMKAEQMTVEELWDNVEALFKEGFVQSESSIGAILWEKALQIIPKDTESIELRNFRIMGRLNEDLPYTQRTLLRQLKALCGENGVTLELNNNDYKIEVVIALWSKQFIDEVYSLVDREAPQNLLIDVRLLYNTHNLLGKYAHNELAKSNHQQLREEVLS